MLVVVLLDCLASNQAGFAPVRFEPANLVEWGDLAVVLVGDLGPADFAPADLAESAVLHLQAGQGVQPLADLPVDRKLLLASRRLFAANWAILAQAVAKPVVVFLQSSNLVQAAVLPVGRTDPVAPGELLPAVAPLELELSTPALGQMIAVQAKLARMVPDAARVLHWQRARHSVARPRRWVQAVGLAAVVFQRSQLGEPLTESALPVRFLL